MALIVGVVLAHGLFLGAEERGPGGPHEPVSFATQPMDLARSYRLREGFHPHAIFPSNDHNLYFHLRWSEFIPTHVVPRAGAIAELRVGPDVGIGSVVARTGLGELSLDEVIQHPRSRIQGFIVVYEGSILYEAYPGMRDTDLHIWMSTSKTIASLLIGQLEEAGRINIDHPIDRYLTEFKGTQWEGIRIIDLLDMSTGLDASETATNVMNLGHPVSQWQRLVLHGGEDAKPRTSKDAILAVANDPNLAAGESFQYSSLTTQILGFLIERVVDQRLADIIADRIWSKIGAEGDATLGLNDSGGPGIFALVSSRLRDKARYGLLYTPSWSTVARERLVSPGIIAKIQDGCRPDLYERAKADAKAAGTRFFSDDPDVRCNSRQWDAVYRDGDLYKSGSHGQGLYVSPTRDLVVAYFSTSYFSWQDYARGIAKKLAPL